MKKTYFCLAVLCAGLLFIAATHNDAGNTSTAADIKSISALLLALMEFYLLAIQNVLLFCLEY